MPNFQKLIRGLVIAVPVLMTNTTTVLAQQVIDFSAPNFGDSNQFCQNSFGERSYSNQNSFNMQTFECVQNGTRSNGWNIGGGTGGVNGGGSGGVADTTSSTIFSMGDLCNYKYSQPYHNGGGKDITRIMWNPWKNICSVYFIPKGSRLIR
jgi:hypothetical protein